MKQEEFDRLIREAKAEAWDEGAEADAASACAYPCGSCDGCTGPELVNPYRGAGNA